MNVFVRGDKIIVFLQYITHKCVAETNISKQVKQEVFGLFFHLWIL